MKNNWKIDYRLLAWAIDFYERKGYKYVNLPWVASLDAINNTKPKNKKDFHLYDDEFLVGSGEQSFTQLLINGKIDEGKYCGITPCFRDDEIDMTHNKCFMKLELIKIFDADMKNVEGQTSDVQEDAMEFFVLNGEGVEFERKTINQWEPDYQVDILTKNTQIELGSYGFRSLKGTKWQWIYGTGLAEPRFSWAIKSDINCSCLH